MDISAKMRYNTGIVDKINLHLFVIAVKMPKISSESVKA